MPRRARTPESSESSERSDDESLDFDPDEEISDADDDGDSHLSPDWTDPTTLHVVYPNAQEVESTRSQILQRMNLRKALNLEHDALEPKFLALKKQIEENEDKILHLKASIAPIRRLPLELLSNIISIHGRDHLQPVWGVMRVCRVWRAATLLTKDVWNAILLCAPKTPHTSMARGNCGRVGLREVCDTEQRLGRALLRAGTVPLEIYASVRCASETSHVLSLFKYIEKVIPAPRLRALKMDSVLWQSVLPQDFLALWNLSLLEELDTRVEHLLKKALNTSPSLIKLEICAKDLQKSRRTKYFQHIRELTVSGTADPTFFDELSGCQAVENLNFKVEVARDTFSKISMPQVRHLELVTTALWPIDCPNISYLLVSPPKNPGSIPRTVLLPNLLELHVVNSALSTKHNLLLHFDTPKLHLLDLADSDSPQYITSRVVGEIWPQDPERSKLDPFILKLRDVSINVKVLTRAISHLARCVELHLINVISTPEFFEQMCQQERKGDKKRKVFILLPNLQRLVIEVKHHRTKEFPAADYLTAASTFLKRRKALRRPLTRFAIKTPYDKSWHELVED